MSLYTDKNISIFLLFIFLFIVSVNSYAQDSYTWENFVEKLFESEDSELSSWQNFYDDFNEIHEHPYNLNQITREQLESLNFLSPQLVENMLYYLYRYGPMKSLGELQLVEGMDYETRHWLPLFVYVGEVEQKSVYPKLKNVLKYGKHSLITRVDIPLYKRAGYREYSDSILAKYPNRKYLGSPYYHSLRYNFHYGSKVYWGINMEKDAGEPMFGKGIATYDYVSCYFMLKDMGRLNTLLLGNYRLNYGLGLVMNTDFSLGKLAVLSTMGTGKGIKKHSGTSESNYFRGAALSYSLLKNLKVDLFYSFKPEDANLNDSLFITSFKTDGYHRTPKDISKRNNITNEVIGSHLSYRYNALHLGLTGVYNRFNTPLIKGKYNYNQFDPEGDHFYSTAVDYSYYNRSFNLFGETALDQQGALATCNSLHWQITDRYKLIFLYRYYDKRYQAHFANSFAEGSKVRNEQGCYLGLQTTLSTHLKFNGYFDYFKFQSPKYQMSIPADGWEAMGEVNSTFNKVMNFMVKYRFKSRPKDVKNDQNKLAGIASQYQHRLQGRVNLTLSPHWVLKTNGYYNRLYRYGESPDCGYLISQELSWQGWKNRLKFNLSGGYYHTDSYDSRVYTYESGPLYAYNFLSFYGHGLRLATQVRMDFNDRLMVLCKYGHTRYFDRSTISSDTEQIDGNQKNDLYIQMRLNF